MDEGDLSGLVIKGHCISAEVQRAEENWFFNSPTWEKWVVLLHPTSVPKSRLKHSPSDPNSILRNVIGDKMEEIIKWTFAFLPDSFFCCGAKIRHL